MNPIFQLTDSALLKNVYKLPPICFMMYSWIELFSAYDNCENLMLVQQCSFSQQILKYILYMSKASYEDMIFVPFLLYIWSIFTDSFN